MCQGILRGSVRDGFRDESWSDHGHLGHRRCVCVPAFASHAQTSVPDYKAAEAARARYNVKMDKALSDQQKLWERWSVAFCTGCGISPSTRSSSTSPLRVLAGTATILDDGQFTSVRVAKSEPKVRYARLVRRLNRTRYSSTIRRGREQRQARALRRYWHKHYAQKRAIPSSGRARLTARQVQVTHAKAVHPVATQTALRSTTPVQPIRPGFHKTGVKLPSLSVLRPKIGSVSERSLARRIPSDLHRW